MASAPTSSARSVPELARAAVGALRVATGNLERAVTLCQELQEEAFALETERDAAILSKEGMRDLFDGACSERDNALEELSRTRLALDDLAKRVESQHTTIESLDAELRRAKLVISVAGVSPHVWQQVRAVEERAAREAGGAAPDMTIARPGKGD